MPFNRYKLFHWYPAEEEDGSRILAEALILEDPHTVCGCSKYLKGRCTGEIQVSVTLIDTSVPAGLCAKFGGSEMLRSKRAFFCLCSKKYLSVNDVLSAFPANKRENMQEKLSAASKTPPKPEQPVMTSTIRKATPSSTSAGAKSKMLSDSSKEIAESFIKAYDKNVIDVAALKNRIAIEKSLNAQKDAEIIALKKQIADQTGSHAQKDTKIIALEKNILAEKDAEISSLKKQIADESRLTTEKEAENFALQKQVADGNHQIAQITDELIALNKQIAASETSDNTPKDAEILALKQQIADETSFNVEKDAQIFALTTQIGDEISVNTQRDAEILTLKEQIAAETSLNIEKEAKNIELEEKLSNWKARAMEFERQLEEKDECFGSLQREIVGLKDALGKFGDMLKGRV